MINDDFDPDDDLHRTLDAFNVKYGRGDVKCVVFDPRPFEWEGVTVWAEVVITEREYGIGVDRFTITRKPGQFTVRMHGRQRTVQSDYFDDFDDFD